MLVQLTAFATRLALGLVDGLVYYGAASVGISATSFEPSFLSSWRSWASGGALLTEAEAYLQLVAADPDLTADARRRPR